MLILLFAQRGAVCWLKHTKLLIFWELEKGGGDFKICLTFLPTRRILPPHPLGGGEVAS